MLVLGQKVLKRADEVILLLPDGRQIVVALVKVEPGRARLGITAPPDVLIHRRSVLERIRAASGKKSPTAAAPEP